MALIHSFKTCPVKPPPIEPALFYIKFPRYQSAPLHRSFSSEGGSERSHADMYIYLRLIGLLVLATYKELLAIIGVRSLVIFSTIFSCLGVLFSTIICKSCFASNKSIMSEFVWLMHENSLASSTVGFASSSSVLCLRDHRRRRDNSNSHHDDVYRTYIASKSIVGCPRTVQIPPSRKFT